MRGTRAMALAALVAAAAVGEDGRPGGDANADGLRAQVERLARELAEARAEADALKAALDRRQFGESGAGERVHPLAVGGVAANAVRILDVNRAIRMVILNVGAREGIRAGVTFMVVRADRSVARIRVTDVRPTIAGAVIESVEARGFPDVDDRAVMVGTLPK